MPIIKILKIEKNWRDFMVNQFANIHSSIPECRKNVMTNSNIYQPLQLVNNSNKKDCECKWVGVLTHFNFEYSQSNQIYIWCAVVYCVCVRDNHLVSSSNELLIDVLKHEPNERNTFIFASRNVPSFFRIFIV